MTQEALKLALVALMRSRKAVSGDLDLAGCAYGKNDPDGHRYSAAKKALVTLDKAIIAIKEALAQPEQEPTWWLVEYHDWAREFTPKKPEESIAVEKITALYTEPPQRTWVGLTDVEIDYLLGSTVGENEETHISFARAIESKLKEVNT